MIPRHIGLTQSAFPPGQIQAVTFNSQIALSAGGKGGTYNGYNVARMRQRKLTREQMAAVGALLSKRTATWEVWADVLALATAVGDAPLPPPAPKISDQIIDSSSVLWIVKHVFDPLPTQPQAYVMLCWLGVP